MSGASFLTCIILISIHKLVCAIFTLVTSWDSFHFAKSCGSAVITIFLSVSKVKVTLCLTKYHAIKTSYA